MSALFCYFINIEPYSDIIYYVCTPLGASPNQERYFMKELMKSVSGIRGIFGIGINPENTMRFAANFGIFQKRKHPEKRIKIVVGRDSRTTGEALSFSVISGLLSVGIDVVWLGIVATPTLLLCVKDTEAQGGICITASHNPAEWNAMKFIDSNGMFLYPETMTEFLATLETIENALIRSDTAHPSLRGTKQSSIINVRSAEKVEYVSYSEMGKKFDDFEASWRHIQKVLNVSYIDVKSIRKMKYKVVLDSVNGAGGVISPNLLREFGCEVIEINSEPTGYFSHNPEPLAENLSQICQMVKETKADIGFATDPDVDRLVIIDEKGECIGEEFSLLLAMKYVLGHKKSDVVTNLSSSMAAEDITKEYGVNVIRTPIGEINVSKKMKAINAHIGGEGNGGIICPEVNYTRDAVTGMALILGYMAQRKQKISILASEIPRYFFAKDKINLNSVHPSLLAREQSSHPSLRGTKQSSLINQ